jgi:hypothetical protein
MIPAFLLRLLGVALVIVGLVLLWIDCTDANLAQQNNGFLHSRRYESPTTTRSLAEGVASMGEMT